MIESYFIPLLIIEACVCWIVVKLSDVKQLLKDIRDLLKEDEGDV